MPYVNSSIRKDLDNKINALLDKMALYYDDSGALNYMLTRLIWGVFKERSNYEQANILLGVLEAVKLEFYRRKVAPYEDQKRDENGDIE